MTNDAYILDTVRTPRGKASPAAASPGRPR